MLISRYYAIMFVLCAIITLLKLYPHRASAATLALILALEYIVMLENRSQTHSKHHNVFQYNADAAADACRLVCLYTCAIVFVDPPC